ncbi:glycosyltransferase family 69 protein [Aspergillus clavatus NRRL 1]|uniref:Polysaccharide export protein (CAP59), putative n=1 Tax=Aspergillus clavatus (strain ATCC 1007 / CBS 513.65 / DSM 816 / NCTC 3887 / NRRL 1 / QM 1276 / 107) TaxID=344612 RepID=A1C4W7_ASPCL|nr:polysaccharide export protein (CAP59), putative [Aspergillus clavatus NRRL 1]EAW14735.1 polysaccharide export protein (CAP59), putative [Aspergillus clavatus NRRL 1]
MFQKRGPYRSRGCYGYGGLFRRFSLRRRLLVGALICSVLWTVFEALYVYHRVAVVDSTQHQLARYNDGTGQASAERIFIASTHWNNEAILRSHWNDAVVQLATSLGPDRVFVSVYESGSWDDSKGALRALDAQLDRLGVRRNITLSEITHQDEISVAPALRGAGWIDTSRGQRELRRIPYLARPRNLSLRPLEDLARQGIVFDKVLFLNDVVFTVNDVLTLLNTNGGNYAAACSLDFSQAPLYMTPLRSAMPTATNISRRHGHISARRLHGTRFSSWLLYRCEVAGTAWVSSFSPVHSVLLITSFPSVSPATVAMPVEPFLSTPALRFRGIPDSLAQLHLEASECCLIHADNPLSRTHGVYLNPQVRVGYNDLAYAAVHPSTTWLTQQPQPQPVALALWGNRLRRWFTGWLVRIKKSRIQRKVAEWGRNHDGIREPGTFCLIDEMQVVVAHGWAHV